MRFLLLGGSGFIGTPLADALLRQGHEVVVTSRTVRPALPQERGPTPVFVRWDGRSPELLAGLLASVDAVVNLIGENIGARRWSAARKARIQNSRMDAGSVLSTAFLQLKEAGKTMPHTLIQASACGWYGLWQDMASAPECTEDRPAGCGFLAETAVLWEASTGAVEALGVRRCLLRTAPVLGRNAIRKGGDVGGFLARMLPPFRWFAGGPLGSGKQPMSWIHLEDEVAAICFLASRRDLSGPYNLAAPESVSMGTFASTLGAVLHRPSLLRVPAPLLRVVLGRMADELILSGQRTAPRRLTEAGFVFRHPELAGALADVLD